jgi:hypothetical protein
MPGVGTGGSPLSRPNADHPWRRGSSVTRASSRWRAHRTLPNAQTRFAQRPQAIPRGHVYFVKNGDISISR